MTDSKRLTAEERTFAEQNLGVVYMYLKMKGYDLEEYFDIAIFGYLKAVQLYMRKPELRRYKFSTIAQHQMFAEIHREWTDRNRMKRKEDIPAVRLDSMNRETEKELYETVSTVEDFADELITQLYWQRVLLKLKPDDRRLIGMMLDGLNIREMAEREGTSHQAVHQRITRIRNMLEPARHR